MSVLVGVGWNRRDGLLAEVVTCELVEADEDLPDEGDLDDGVGYGLGELVDVVGVLGEKRTVTRRLDLDVSLGVLLDGEEDAGLLSCGISIEGLGPRTLVDAVPLEVVT